jgi:hypothetical protein
VRLILLVLRMLLILLLLLLLLVLLLLLLLLPKRQRQVLLLAGGPKGAVCRARPPRTRRQHSMRAQRLAPRLPGAQKGRGVCRQRA